MQVQTKIVQVQIARFAESFEKEVHQYPRFRYEAINEQLQKWKDYAGELQQKLEEARTERDQARQLGREVTLVNSNIEKIATNLQQQFIPQMETIVNLKTHVASLYQRLGCSDAKAWYHTLVESKEYDQLGPFVSLMMKEGHEKAKALAGAADPRAQVAAPMELRTPSIYQLSSTYKTRSQSK